MHEQGATVLWKIRQAGFQLPPLREVFAKALDLSKQTIENILAAPVRELGESLWNVTLTERHLESARFQNKRARQELDSTYLWTGRLTQALCHLVGEDELARRTHKPLRKIDRRLRPKKREVPEAETEATAGVVQGVTDVQESDAQVADSVTVVSRFCGTPRSLCAYLGMWDSASPHSKY